MTATDSLPEEVVAAAAENLGPFLRRAGVEENLGIGESLQVWTVALSEIRSPGGVPLAKRTEWAGVWHHQLRRLDDGAAVAYARSLALASGVLEIRSVFCSPLAAEIDAVIAWLDKKLSDEVSIVRLLVVLDLEWLAVWIASTSGDRFIPLTVESSSTETFNVFHKLLEGKEGGEGKFDRLAEPELRELFRDREAIVGISRGTPPPLLANRRLAKIEGEVAELKSELQKLRDRFGLL
jgi:hypothetical protein